MKDFYLLEENTPSQKDGMKKEEEKENRKQGALLIEKTGKKIFFPQKTILTAQYYFQLFYTKKSMFCFPFLDIALTCILVASKVEGTERKIEEIVSAALFVLNPQLKKKDTFEIIDKYFDKINQYEIIVLKNIDCIFNIKHVHLYLLKIGKKHQIHQEDVYEAWKRLNTIYHSQIVLNYPFPLLAISVIISTIGKRNSHSVIIWGEKLGFRIDEQFSLLKLFE